MYGYNAHHLPMMALNVSLLIDKAEEGWPCAHQQRKVQSSVSWGRPTVILPISQMENWTETHNVNGLTNL